MFVCFEGTPGSGKSYDSIKKILDNLKRKRVVYTNIDGVFDAQQQEFIKWYTSLDDYELSSLLVCLDASNIHTFYKQGKKGYLAIIDEAHKPFNSRDWQSEKNRLFADWASTHRHEGVDCILVTQDASKIDSQVRTLFEWTYRYRKMNFFGSLMENQYMVTAYAGDGDGKPIGKKIYSYDKKIFNCYKSYVADDIKESGFMTKMNILKHPIFYILGACIVLFIYMFSKSSYAHGKIIRDVRAQPVSNVVSTVTPTAPQAVQQRPGPRRSSRVPKVAVKSKEGYYVVTGKVQTGADSAIYSLRKAADRDEDEAETFFIDGFNLDTACKCFSNSKVRIGDEYQILADLLRR